MSTTKAEIKKGTAQEIGVKLDDALEAAEKQIAVFGGMSSGASSVAKKLHVLVKAVQGEIDEGKLSMPDNELHLGGMLIHQIKRCIAVAESDAQGYDKRRLQQEGIVAGLRMSVKTTKQVYDAEDAKAKDGKNGTPRGEAAREARRKEVAARKKTKKKATKKVAKKTKKKATKKSSPRAPVRR